jgi:hypothetical protein
MSLEESLWLYVTVPALLVISLIIIKLAQLRMNKQERSDVKVNGIQIRKVSKPQPVAQKGLSAPVGNIQQEETKGDVQEKPPNCQKYLGYLYMRQGAEKLSIPTECYDCRRLLQCLYSPNVIERVYGQ